MIAAIIAGGDNTRYPMPKGLIDVNGKRIIEAQMETLSSLGLEVVISTNSPGQYGYTGARLIADTIKRAGPMSGVVSVFDATGADEIFITACDMPFIMPEMIEYIISNKGRQATVPYPGGEPEPLLALYSREAAEVMRRRIEKDNASMRRMLGAIEVRRISDEEIKNIDPARKSFININTPQDFEAAAKARGLDKGGNQC